MRVAILTPDGRETTLERTPDESDARFRQRVNLAITLLQEGLEVGRETFVLAPRASEPARRP
jgi:hypothetical protein